MVVKTGRNEFARMMYYPSLDVPPYKPSTPNTFAVGTGTTSPSDSDTALESQVTYRLIHRIIPGNSKLNFQCRYEDGDAVGYTLTEAALMAGGGGTRMFTRATHTGITKTSTMELIYDWTINLESA